MECDPTPPPRLGPRKLTRRLLAATSGFFVSRGPVPWEGEDLYRRNSVARPPPKRVWQCCFGPPEDEAALVRDFMAWSPTAPTPAARVLPRLSMLH